ncbi:MAG: LPS-assembly protein LptD [Candidatus Riflebacteria bacterium]|nr:LPS-assembly protein LptD [Candidatus Riflebacteria bacterium]
MKRLINPRILLNILAVFLLFFASAVTSYAFTSISMDTQKFPVEVQCDYLEYKIDTQQVIAKGNAFVTYQDMQIKADTVQADVKEEQIFAEGDVDFWKGYDRIKGSVVSYNMKTGKGHIKEAKIIKNMEVIEADEIYLSPERSEALNISHTTCDREPEPHYQLRADKIEIRAGDSMLIENMKAKWHGKTLLSLSEYTSSLKEKKKKFFSAKVGTSNIDGIYLKFSSDLEVNNYVSGVLLADFFQKRGEGVGFRGNYSTPGNKITGNIYVYTLNERNRDRISTSGSISFSTAGSLSGNIQYNAEKLPGYSENQDLTLSLNYRPKFNLLPNMQINATKFFDLDGGKYTLDNNYQILNKMPEVSFSLPTLKHKALPLSFNISGMYGRYEEGPLSALETTQKISGNLRATTPPVKIDQSFVLTPSYSYDASSYSNGESRQNSNTMLRANWNLSKEGTLDMSYNLSKSYGKSPFRFDSSTSTDSISGSLRFNKNNWTFNPLNITYNRLRGRLEQIYWDYSRRSPKDAYRSWEFFIRRDYDAGNIRFSNLTLSDIKPTNLNMRYRMAGELWSFDTSVTVPHALGRISNTSLNYKTVIRPLWEISLTTNYNNISKKFSPLRVGLIRDLHCWEAKAEYNHERQEFWMEFYLKASPEDSGRFSYGIDDNRLRMKIASYDQLLDRYDL